MLFAQFIRTFFISATFLFIQQTTIAFSIVRIKNTSAYAVTITNVCKHGEHDTMHSMTIPAHYLYLIPQEIIHFESHFNNNPLITELAIEASCYIEISFEKTSNFRGYLLAEGIHMSTYNHINYNRSGIWCQKQRDLRKSNIFHNITPAYIYSWEPQFQAPPRTELALDIDEKGVPMLIAL